MKKTIIIAGGGFAGLEAFDHLIGKKKSLSQEFDIVLIDKKKTFDFLPLAPDVLAGWLNPERAQIDLSSYVQKRGGTFIQGAVEKIMPEADVVRLKDKELRYEYLIIATGGETNFFGNTSARKNCLVLNSVHDAFTIKKILIDTAKSGSLSQIVVAGGGYTGLECLLNAHYLLKSFNVDAGFTLVEKAPHILSGVPESIRKQAEAELEKHGIHVITNETVRKFDKGTVTLKSGKTIENAVCIWSAGVKSPDILEGLNAEKTKGRIKVNADLTVKDKKYKNVFLAGDSAAFMEPQSDKPLRMGVMFAINEGKTAAENIIRSIQGEKTRGYKPRDLGYLIPLVYGKAPGLVLGRKTNGRIGWFLHYFLSMYRSKPFKIPGMLKDLFFSRILHMTG